MTMATGVQTIFTQMQRRLTFDGLINLAGWGIAAVFVALLLLNLLIFYAYGWIPAAAPPAELGRPVSVVAEADLAFARELLKKRREAFESSLKAPSALPNPFR